MPIKVINELNSTRTTFFASLIDPCFDIPSFISIFISETKLKLDMIKKII